MDSIPYFRFDCAQWLAGKISRRSFEEKGLLVEIMVLALSKGGWMPWDKVEREDFADDNRVDLDHLESLVAGLVRRGILILEDNKLSTKFVLETKQKVLDLREKRSKAGSKGGRPKAIRKQLESNCFSDESKEEAKKTNASNTNTNTNSNSLSSTLSNTLGLPIHLGDREPLYRKFLEVYTENGGGIHLNPNKVRQAIGSMNPTDLQEIIDAIPTAAALCKERCDSIPCGSKFIAEGLWTIKATPEQLKTKADRIKKPNEDKHDGCMN